MQSNFFAYFSISKPFSSKNVETHLFLQTFILKNAHLWILIYKRLFPYLLQCLWASTTYKASTPFSIQDETSVTVRLLVSAVWLSKTSRWCPVYIYVWQQEVQSSGLISKWVLGLYKKQLDVCILMNSF